jgi:hypothetical protein
VEQAQTSEAIQAVARPRPRFIARTASPSASPLRASRLSGRFIRVPRPTQDRSGCLAPSCRQRALPANLACFDPTGLLGDFSDQFKTVPSIPAELPLPESQLLIATSLTVGIATILAGVILATRR